ALIESFKHLRPVWLEMFRKDPGFLADDPAKAALLFRPLLARQELQLPGFITAEPGSSKYGVSPLSEEEVQQLTGVPAFDDFRESHPNLFIDPSGAQTAPPASGDEAALTENLGEVVIHLAALPGKMMFDQDTVSIPAGKTVSLIFDNSDQMAHNVVIVTPGAWEKVGQAADEMSAAPDGYERSFIPDMPEVLFSTPLVTAGETFRLDFTAPSKPGDYPFICTFPGHWRMMKGVFRIVNQ
ncbi:MAG TPA: plastocyanin/azurin family copper-binding protein, partial [Anseongella sp.]